MSFSVTHSSPRALRRSHGGYGARPTQTHAMHRVPAPLRSLIFGILVALTVLGAGHLLQPTYLSAQTRAGTFVAIPDEFPSINAKAMVVREPGIDLVLLKDGEVTLDALSMALHVLRDARERVPAPAIGYLIPITGFVVEKAVEGPARRALEQTLERLTDAETVDLGSLGTGRRIRLPGR